MIIIIGGNSHTALTQMVPENVLYTKTLKFQNCKIHVT